MASSPQQTTRASDSARSRRLPPPDEKRRAAKTTRPANLPPRRHWLWFAGLLLANYIVARLLAPSPEAPVPVPYTLFREEVGKGNVTAIYSRGDTLTGRFKNPVTVPPPPSQRATGAGAPARRVSRRRRPRSHPRRRSCSPPRCPPSSGPAWKHSCLTTVSRSAPHLSRNRAVPG